MQDFSFFQASYFYLEAAWLLEVKKATCFNTVLTERNANDNFYHTKS